MTRVILLLVIWLSLTATATAGSLFGKVVEINDGETITIYSLNKPVKIRLIAVGAPGEGQRFSDVAKQHLSELVLFRSVSVEYSGFVENNYLLGKVFYKEMDIGAQMIRDGVAWFDPRSSDRLTDAERQIYAESQSAARSERRGLWQDAAPVAPWEFKQQQAVTAVPASASPAKKPADQARPLIKKELGTEDLLAGLTGGSTLRSSSDAGSIAFEWRKLEPENERFSVMVPGVGEEGSMSFYQGTGVRSASFWIGEYDGASYILIWSTGPNYTYTDESAIEGITKGAVEGLNAGLKMKGVGFAFEYERERALKVNNYYGIQYKLKAMGVEGTVRAFSKRVGDDRGVYFLGVLRRTEKDPSVEKFFSSLSFRKSK
jgi:endonuclease YncB( thermonuclease family)